MNKMVSVNDLEEGMIVNDFYFNNPQIIELLDEIDGNLGVYKTKNNKEFKYYFK